MKKILSVLLTVAFFSSCATSIPVKLLKPAEINLGAAKSIAVLPFSFPSQIQTPGMDPYNAAIYRLWYVDARENRTEKKLALAIESKLGTAILDTKFFTVLSSNELKTSLSQTDTNKKPNADVVVTGAITNFTNTVLDKSFEDTETKKWTPKYEASYSFEVRYDVINLKTNAIIASKIKSASGSNTSAGWESAQNESVEEIISRVIPGQIEAITRMIAPYTVTESRVLENDEAKDVRMEAATKFVNDGFYQKAKDIYTTVFADTKNFAAGFNAAIMKEILGDLEGAIKDMNALADDSANIKALKEAQRMQKTLDENKAAADQTGSR